MKIPSSGLSFRTLTVANGNLCQADDKLPHGNFVFKFSHRITLDPLALTPRGILLAEYLENEKSNEPSRSNNLGEEATTTGGSNDKLMIKWNQHHIIWLSPHTLNRLRDEAYQKIELEVCSGKN